MSKKESYEMYICDDTPYKDDENEFNNMSDKEFEEFEEKYLKERYGTDHNEVGMVIKGAVKNEKITHEQIVELQNEYKKSKEKEGQKEK